MTTNSNPDATIAAAADAKKAEVRALLDELDLDALAPGSW
jgi:hypothetical protein